MSKQAQTRRFSPYAGKVARRPSKVLRYLLLAAVFVLVASSAYWLSRKNSAEREREAPLTSAQVPASESPATPAAVPPDIAGSGAETVDNDTDFEEKALSGAYTVLPARAYFYSEPNENSSTGKYVLRGDIIYAEGESGDFIRTRFFAANGDPVAGWLKKTEMRQRKPTAQQAPPRAVAKPAVVVKPPQTQDSAPAQPSAAVDAAAPMAATGTVRVDTTYFYDSPDLTQRRRAFCIRGDKMKLSDASDKAVFATFINWEKVKTTGWVRKEDLTIR